APGATHRNVTASFHTSVTTQPNSEPGSSTPLLSNHRFASTDSASLCLLHPSTATTRVVSMPITPPPVERLSTCDFLLTDRGLGTPDPVSPPQAATAHQKILCSTYSYTLRPEAVGHSNPR